MPSVQIPLTQGKFAICDEADAERILQHRWYAYMDRNTFYAATTVKNKRVRMHSFLFPEAEMVDHKNRDGLDNRRENLRPCTRSQNASNRLSVLGDSGYRGVRTKRSKYQATIEVDGVKRHLGTHTTPEEAAFWYDLAAISAFGEFAVLNFGE